MKRGPKIEVRRTLETYVAVDEWSLTCLHRRFTLRLNGVREAEFYQESLDKLIMLLETAKREVQ